MTFSEDWYNMKDTEMIPLHPSKSIWMYYGEDSSQNGPENMSRIWELELIRRKSEKWEECKQKAMVDKAGI